MKRSFKQVITVLSLAVAASGSAVFAQNANAASKSPTVIEEDFARSLANLKRAKSLIGPKYDIAGAHNIIGPVGKSTFTKKSGEDYVASVIGGFSFGDLNGDGVEDLAVAVENARGLRSLRVYLGNRTGKFALAAQSTTAILRVSHLSDAFDSLSINSKTGILKVAHTGGSISRWDIVQKYQFRGTDLVLIGRKDSNYDSRSGASKSVDRNFLTGEKIVRSTTHDEADRKVRKSHETVRSLTKISETSVLK